MAEVAAVPVEWAALSKHPKRFGGYEVLAASGDRARAEQLIQAAHTGAPGERRQEPDVAQPWTTFLGDGASRPSLGVVERTQTAVPDVTGRPISVARLLTVPWPAPDGPRVGFLGLQLVAAVLVAVSPPPRRAVSPQVTVRTVSLLVRTQSLALDNTAAWQVLAESPELGAGLLQGVLAAKGENQLGRVLEALSPFARNRGAEWVGVAGELFHDARVRLPAGDWPAPVWRVWLAIAVARDQGAAFLSSGWRFVLGEAFGADADGRCPELERMAAVVHGVPMDGMPPPVLATADVLSLAIGGPMTHLARPIDPAYLDALGAAWAEVSPTWRAQLAPRLVGAVLGRLLTPSSFADLRALVDQLGAELAPPAVEEVGRRLISQADLLVQLALDRSWAEDLLRHAPKHGWLRTWFDVHDLARQPGVDPIVLGERYAQLLGQHAELAPAMAAIQPWLQAERAPEELVRLLRGIDERSRSEVLRHLMRANRGNPDATTALLAYVEGEERRLRQQARAFASLREEARRFLDAPPSRPEGEPASLSLWLRRLFGNQEPSDRPGREQHDRT